MLLGFYIERDNDKNITVDSVSMKKFECDVCKKRFDTEVALRQHKNAKHSHEQKSGHHEDKRDLSLISKKHAKRLWIYLIILAIVGFVVWGIYAAVKNPSQIGALGSTHIHADIAIFLDGKQLTPLPPKYFVRSQYMHLEQGPGTGSVLHKHAINVPLNLFFKSLSMNFDDNCLKLDTGQKYCSEGDKQLKMYVKHINSTWEKNSEYEKYIFKDLDKILISFGNEAEDQLKTQMDAVTDFSRDNAGKFMEVG